MKVKLDGRKLPVVADTQYNIALMHRYLGQHDLEAECFDRCAAIYAKVHGDAHSRTADAQEQAAHARRRRLWIQKEKESDEAANAAGGVMIKRLRGLPGTILHTVPGGTLQFDQFATAGAPEYVATCGVMYYEIEVLACDGEAQIGFSLPDGMPVVDGDCDDGVGDDNKSWGVDGTRQRLWHGGDTMWAVEWVVGDTFGLAANVDMGKIAVSKNGSWAEGGCGVVFESDAVKAGVFPCFTGSEGFELQYRFKNFKHSAPTAGQWA